MATVGACSRKTHVKLRQGIIPMQIKYSKDSIKLVLAWDPDFTRVTLHEAERIKKAEESGFISEEDIDWDKIGQ